MNYLKQAVESLKKDNNLEDGELFFVASVPNIRFQLISGNLVDENEMTNNRYDTVWLLNGERKIMKVNNIPKERFKPNYNYKNRDYGKIFYFVNQYGSIENCEDYNVGTSYIVNYNLVFETREHAKDYKWFLDKVDEYKKDWIKKGNNYFLYYNSISNGLVFGSDDWNFRDCDYFGTRENLESFVKEVGEERIKKYMFNVWG